MRDEKFLNGCLMDSDGEARIRARRQRGRTLATALAVEAIVVVCLALWPMITPGSAPGEIVMLPRIPYRGSDTVKQIPAHQSGRAPRLQRTDAILISTLANSSAYRQIEFRAGGKHPAACLCGVRPGRSRRSAWRPAGNGKRHLPDPPRPAGRTRPQIIRLSEGVQSGMLVYRVDPRYPQLAVSAGISGTVQLRAIIGRDGRVRSVEVLSGSPLLTRAAVAAVREWRYRPTLLNGDAVEVQTLVTVRFVLGQ